jgi:hypothetical protein
MEFFTKQVFLLIYLNLLSCPGWILAHAIRKEGTFRYIAFLNIF